MNTRIALRLSATAAIIGAALAAHAAVFTFGGTYTGSFLTPSNFTVDFTHTQGLSGFSFDVDPATTATATGGTSSLSTTLKNFSGTKSLTLTGTGTSVTNNGTSFSGTWTGSSVGLGLKNTGIYSGSFDTDGNYIVSITAQPVPEPASMAALGLGALGILKRRRKA